MDCDFGSAFSCAGLGPDCMCSVFRLKTVSPTIMTGTDSAGCMLLAAVFGMG